MADRFLIAPLKSGLVKDLPVWQTPEDSFYELTNSFIFRGRIKKRVGSNLTGSGAASSLLKPLRSRLRIYLGVTDGAGDLAGTVPGAKFKTGQMFSCGEEIFTVPETGTPVIMLTTGASTTHTFNTTTGAYDIKGSGAVKTVYFYSAEPVMGMSIFESGTLNNQPTFVCDTQFIYKYNIGAWLDSYSAVAFTGSDTDFFWFCNWRGVTPDLYSLFVTNYRSSDNMMTYNGTAWSTFNPAFLVAAGNTIKSARIILPFKDRLVVFNTKELVSSVAKTFTNRCRYSHNGSPLAASAFYEANEVGESGGGYIDAPVKEDIVSAAVIKNRMIVYFEKSTWELMYTGNYMLPFVWQSISSELGSVGTFSVVSFDKNLLTVSDNGITGCNGLDVTRIDNKIPDEVFNMVNTATGLNRLYGVRDFYNETVYWTYYTYDNSALNYYPDKMLVYNYNNSTWAFNDDTFTCFGYMEQDNEEHQRQPDKVIAGNQQGFILSLNKDKYNNAPSMQISQMVTGLTDCTITAVYHNLLVGDYVEIKNAQGVVAVGDGIYRVTERTDINTIKLDTTFTGTYTGGGTLSRVSKLSIKSTEWNPYVNKGLSVSIPNITFCVKKTTAGQVTVDYLISSSTLSMVAESGVGGTACNMGSNILDTNALALVPFESQQERLWHDVYLQACGDGVQIHLTMSDDQMKDPDISQANLEIEGILLHTESTGGDL